MRPRTPASSPLFATRTISLPPCFRAFYFIPPFHHHHRHHHHGEIAFPATRAHKTESVLHSGFIPRETGGSRGHFDRANCLNPRALFAKLCTVSRNLSLSVSRCHPLPPSPSLPSTLRSTLFSRSIFIPSRSGRGETLATSLVVSRRG